jgi:hypothetical protein
MCARVLTSRAVPRLLAQTLHATRDVERVGKPTRRPGFRLSCPSLRLWA